MSQPQSNLPARRPQADVAQQEMTLQQLVKRFEGNIRAALPEHIKPERMLSIIRTAITSNPGLAKCSPMSVIAGIVAASRLGLECDGTLGQAYLIPRWNKNTKRMEASFQIGYQGKLELTYRTGKVDVIRTRLVHANDVFEFTYTPEAKLVHQPCYKGDPGPVVCAYTYVKYKDGTVDVFEPMPVEEAYKIRDQYAPRERCPKCWGRREQREHCDVCKGTGEGDRIVGPWADNPEEMIRKTKLHRDWKWMPKSVEIHEAMRYEARIEGQQEAPELVVLDLPVEESESAQIAGATDARKEDLKAKLAEKTAPKPQETPQPQQAPAPVPEEKAAPEPAAAAQQAVPAEIPVFDGEWPDAFDGPECIWNGVHYRFSEESGNYRKVEEAPRVKAPQPPQQTRRGRQRNADAFDFNSGGNR